MIRGKVCGDWERKCEFGCEDDPREPEVCDFCLRMGRQDTKWCQHGKDPINKRLKAIEKAIKEQKKNIAV